MAPRPTRLLALSLLIGAVGCGVVKPQETTGVDPAGGDSGLGGAVGSGGEGGSGGAGPSGSGGLPFGGMNGSGGGESGSASGGTTVTGAGGAPSGGGTSGSGNAGATESGGVGGIVAGGTGGVGSIGGASSSGGTAAAGSGGGVSSGGNGGGSTGGAGTGGVTWVDGTCDASYMIPTDVSHFEIDVGNVASAHTVDLPCAGSSPVVVLSFNLMQDELVYADTLGASWDTVLAFADACDGTWNTLPAAGTSACNDNACGTSQSQAVALLGYGQHYLYVGGPRGTRGVATVHFQHAPVGSGLLKALPAGSGTTTGATQGRGAVNLCQASGAENSYWWQSCPAYAGGALSASTCTGTTFDTVLSLQIPRSGAVSCADDDPSCGVQSKMSATIPAGAGIYVLTVDGTAGRDQGNYTLTFTRP